MLKARILYSGDREWTGDLVDIGDAPKQEVLIMSVGDPDTRTVIAQCSGYDYYCLAYRSGITVAGGTQVMLFGWDEGDYQWRGPGQVPDNVTPPISPWHTLFQGVLVGDAEWQAAQNKFTRG